MKGRHALAAAWLAVYGMGSPRWLAVICYVAAFGFLMAGHAFKTITPMGDSNWPLLKTDWGDGVTSYRLMLPYWQSRGRRYYCWTDREEDGIWWHVVYAKVTFGPGWKMGPVRCGRDYALREVEA